MFEDTKRCEEFVVQSCENLMDVDVPPIVGDRYEKASLALHEICRSAIRRALGPGPGTPAGEFRKLTA